jgi:FLVCR family MFS transporter 7
MLPVGLELAVEVTRNAEASSSLLFGIGNGAGVIVLAIEDALRAGPNANPPLNMKKGLIFQGVLVLVITFLGFGIRGTQTRRAKDEAEAMESVDGTEEMSDVQAVRTLHQNQTESFGSPTAVDSKA